MVSEEQGVPTPEPRRRRGVVGAGVLAVSVVALGGVAVARWARDDAVTVPSPLFDQVEQLTPTTLPEGWARCGGGPSDRPDASERWWAQTFGPVEAGHCTPLITVTQVPMGERVRHPEHATNGRVGNSTEGPGAINWRDDAEGSRGVYASGAGRTQWLVIEGCCGEEATGANFDLLAVAARDGTREQEPARCTKPESDLDQESFVGNSFGSRERAYGEDDCPIRRDIVSWHTEPEDAHCWQGMTFLVLGTPLGHVITTDGARLYTRDPLGVRSESGGAELDQDLDTELPPMAADTGYHQRGSALWVVPGDDDHVYVVSGEHVEAWPRDRTQYACA
jgi:hypothetical protein